MICEYRELLALLDHVEVIDLSNNDLSHSSFPSLHKPHRKHSNSFSFYPLPFPSASPLDLVQLNDNNNQFTQADPQATSAITTWAPSSEEKTEHAHVLPSLQHLILRNNNLDRVPRFVCSLTSLCCLHLELNALNSLKGGFSENLTYLSAFCFLPVCFIASH